MSTLAEHLKKTQKFKQQAAKMAEREGAPVSDESAMARLALPSLIADAEQKHTVEEAEAFTQISIEVQFAKALAGGKLTRAEAFRQVALWSAFGREVATSGMATFLFAEKHIAKLDWIAAKLGKTTEQLIDERLNIEKICEEFNIDFAGSEHEN